MTATRQEERRPSARGARPPLHRRARERGREAVAGVVRRRDRAFGLELPEPAARRTGPAYALFAVAALFYPLHQLLTRGDLLLGGSMWAEMATNYFLNAQADSLRVQLLATDAGYIPLPQRILALVGHELGVPPAAVPYLYTGAAVVLGALLLASICLPSFRPVVASDGVRFVLAITLMLVPDFETRTFINFTYFGVVPAAALTALALVQRDREVPRWAWFVPLFLLSKPGVLAVLPAMLLVAVVSRPRFRRVAIASAVMGMVQVVQIVRSALSGSSLLQASEETALSKLLSAVLYTLGFLGKLLLGPGTLLGPRGYVLWGTFFLLVIVAAAVFLRSRATPLVAVGLSLLFFTMVIDAFTFPLHFGPNLAMLSTGGFDRRLIAAVVGVLMVLAGLVAMVVESPRTAALAERVPRWGTPRTASVLATALVTAWVLGGGWLQYGAMINRPFGVPMADVSQWQRMAPVMSSAEPVVCVPLDPFSWVGGRNCTSLVNDGGIPFAIEWTAAEQSGEDWELELPPPPEVQAGELASVAVMLRPPTGVESVTGRAVLTDQEGRETELTAEAELAPGGGILHFYEMPTPMLTDVASVRLVFDRAVEVGYRDEASGGAPLVLWMGHPGPAGG